MVVLNSKDGVTNVPEMAVGTRFKIKDWFNGIDFPKGKPNVEFEVMEALPDETGFVPCHCEAHQCAFDGICGNAIDCPCGANERQDGKSVRYVEFIDGQEYHW